MEVCGITGLQDYRSSKIYKFLSGLLKRIFLPKSSPKVIRIGCPEERDIPFTASKIQAGYANLRLLFRCYIPSLAELIREV
jgi:hypothetical protein